MTTLCLPPFTLTITGSGFLSLLPWSQVELRDPSSTGSVADTCYVTEVLNATALECSLFVPPMVSTLPHSPVLDLVVLALSARAATRWWRSPPPSPG